MSPAKENNPIHHHIKHKILVIGTSGCGKTTLIESILSRTNNPIERHPSGSGTLFKCCSYSQSVKFREIEIELKIFERTIDGPLDRQTIQPYYLQVDTIIGVYDNGNFSESFGKLRLAMDSLLEMIHNRQQQQQQQQQKQNDPTVLVLGNIRDHRRCKSHGPYQAVKDYVDKINAIQLFNYCYSSRHIKAFHYLMMFNVYRKHFREEMNDTFEMAIQKCRKHIYSDHTLFDYDYNQHHHHNHNQNNQNGENHRNSINGGIIHLKNLRLLFQRLKSGHHHNHHYHHQKSPNNNHLTEITVVE